jgi:hypothetical protein
LYEVSTDERDVFAEVEFVPRSMPKGLAFRPDGRSTIPEGVTKAAQQAWKLLSTLREKPDHFVSKQLNRQIQKLGLPHNFRDALQQKWHGSDILSALSSLPSPPSRDFSHWHEVERHQFRVSEAVWQELALCPCKDCKVRLGCAAFFVIHNRHLGESVVGHTLALHVLSAHGILASKSVYWLDIAQLVRVLSGEGSWASVD